MIHAVRSFLVALAVLAAAYSAASAQDTLQPGSAAPDFDLPEIQLYVCDNGDGTRTIMLPSEY